MKSILVRVLLGFGLFITCTGICLFGWYAVGQIALGTAGPIMGSGGRDLTSGESVTVVFLLFLPLGLFPGCAWFFRRWLGTLPSVFLGVSPILLPILFFSMIDFFRYLDQKKNEHPVDGTREAVYNDERYGKLTSFSTYKENELSRLIRVCQNGNILSFESFEEGKKTGVHFEIAHCYAPYLTKVTTYGDEEKVLDTKRFDAADPIHFIHSYVEKRHNGENKYYRRYIFDRVKKRYYLAVTDDSFNGGSREVRREYDENGELISEKTNSKE